MAKKVLGTGAYSITLVDKARENGLKIRNSRGEAMEPRLMHRDDLSEWIDFNAGVVVDPRKVNPYNPEGSYGASVAALLSNLPSSCSKVTGKLATSKQSISWDTDIIEGKWANEDELFAFAVSKNAKLRRKLANRVSPRPGVKKANRETNPARKFGNNIKTLQRVTGVTPYGKPLAQCNMAIDSRWVRVGSFDIEEFRIVVGRNTPEKQDFRKRDIPTVKEIVRKAKVAVAESTPA